MKKVLHIIDSLGLGGAERLLVDTINSLPNFEHHVIILHHPDQLKGELIKKIHFLNLEWQNNWEVYKQVKRVKGYIRKNKIDLVHSHLFFSNVLARLSVPANIPLFNSLHSISSLDNYANKKLILYIDKWTYRKRHHIIAVSNEVMRDYDKWIGIKGKSTVLYNWINDAFFKTAVKTCISTDTFKLVAVGNLRYPKNYPYLIEAFKQMPRNVTLDIYGDGPLKEELQRDITNYNLNINLQGAQQHIYEKLPLYDAFILSSFYEGQPLSLLEAIACGLPALLSDIPVLREVAGENAVYFNLSDPGDLIKKIESILKGDTDIIKNVKPALQRITSFARKEVYINKVSQLYIEKLKESHL